MSTSDEQEDEVSQRLHSAASSQDVAVAASLIRDSNFIVFKQIDPEKEVDEPVDDGGSFSVVLAEIDEDMAVVCFSQQAAAEDFARDIADDMPTGRELPAIALDGDALLDGLPDDCGLLLNPGSDVECYFPPGALG